MRQIYPWFESANAILSQALQQGRPPHALLLTTPAGCGKKDYAQYIAMSLLCKNANGLTGGCGECKSCHLFLTQNHPDFYLVDCLVDNKGVQKKSIGIDQIRSLTQKLQDTAQMQGWRVTVIRSVSAMTTASFNSLLKSLEEPGEQTLLILLADNLQSVPATVRSRCQLMLADLNETKLLEWLEPQVDFSQEQLLQALKYNQCAPIATLQFLQEDGLEVQKRLFEQLDAVLLNRLSPANFFAQMETPIEVLADKLASYFYQIQLLKIENNQESLYWKLPIKMPFQLYQKVIEYKRAQQAGSNLQVKLQIEAILIQWFEIGRKIGHYSNA